MVVQVRFRPEAAGRNEKAEVEVEKTLEDVAVQGLDLAGTWEVATSAA